MNFVQSFFYTYGSRIIGIIAILCATLYIARFLVSLMERLQKRAAKDRKFAQLSASHLNFAKHVLRGIVYFIGICFALSLIPELQSAAYSLLAGSGIIALMISLASREAVSNMLGGILIQIFKPFQVGSYIKIDNTHEGIVTDVTLHHTLIKTPLQNRLMIPNAIMSNKSIETVPWPKEKIVKQFEVPVSYATGLEVTRNLIEQLLEVHSLVLDTHDKNNQKTQYRCVSVYVESFEPGYILLRAPITVKNDQDFLQVKSDVNAALKKAFDEGTIALSTRALKNGQEVMP